jgi:hypothetical protein
MSSKIERLLTKLVNYLEVRQVAQSDIDTIVADKLDFVKEEGVITSQISCLLAACLRLRKVGKNSRDKIEFLAYFHERESKKNK